MEVGLCLFLLASLTFVNCQEGQANALQWIEIIDKCSLLDNNGLETVALGSNCRAYAACPEQMFRRPTIQLCSPGTLYDQSSKTCYFADQVDCAGRTVIDPCQGIQIGFVRDVLRSLPQQAAGLLCRDGSTLASFKCPPCNDFSETESDCVPVPGCNVNTTSQTGCNLEAIKGNPEQYVAVGVGTRTIMRCNDKTIFRPELCLCV